MFKAWPKIPRLENEVYHIEDLGEGYHFGEWWGQGINRGYGLDHKRFSLFNPTKKSSCCYNVPYLAQSNFEELDSWIHACTDRLVEDGSWAAPGYKRPEGLIIYAEKAKTYWKVILDK